MIIVIITSNSIVIKGRAKIYCIAPIWKRRSPDNLWVSQADVVGVDVIAPSMIIHWLHGHW